MSLIVERCFHLFVESFCYSFHLLPLHCLFLYGFLDELSYLVYVFFLFTDMILYFHPSLLIFLLRIRPHHFIFPHLSFRHLCWFDLIVKMSCSSLPLLSLFPSQPTLQSPSATAVGCQIRWEHVLGAPHLSCHARGGRALEISSSKGRELTLQRATCNLVRLKIMQIGCLLN